MSGRRTSGDTTIGRRKSSQFGFFGFDQTYLADHPENDADGHRDQRPPARYRTAE